MGMDENKTGYNTNPPALSLKEGEVKKPEKKNTIRYHLFLENALVVLSFSLFLVSFFNYTIAKTFTPMQGILIVLGVVLLIFAIITFYKIVKTLQKNDIPIDPDNKDGDELDSETGLYYYDVFAEKVEEAMRISLMNCYMASFQLDGFEHLRYYLGYPKAPETMREIGKMFLEKGEEFSGHRVICGSRSNHEIVIFITECEDVKEARNYLSKLINELNIILLTLPKKETFTAYCGFACYDQHAKTFDELVKYTSFAVTEAELFHKVEPHCFSPDSYRRQEDEYIRNDKVTQILKNNELHYHFQPIVSAKTGKIYAYEALMRTEKKIGLDPTIVLELAARQDRLYEVEHHTFYNVIQIMQEHADSFEDRKLFLNSIPTAIITEKEFDELLEDHAEVMKHLVIEITENGMQSEDSCETVHKYMKKSGCELALDDYGTGYSNVTTLLNNSPQYLKIDHSIIMGIDSDTKKQHLVSNYVDFANNHNMQILAEGVETAEELQMVIQLGCHLIQGFYTGRPNREIVDSIGSQIEEEIVAINLKLAKLKVNNTPYVASNYDNISLMSLALEYYSKINIKESAVRIVGDKNREFTMEVRVEDNIKTNISIRDVKMRGKENPVISLGENSQMILNLEGDNHFYFEGIRVPRSSRLIIQGNGNLTVHVDHNNGVGIGSTLSEPYGNIIFEQEGKIRVESNSDTAIGIGGLFGDENSEIRLSSGSFEILANGSKSVGIGAMEGNVKLVMDQCKVSIYSSGAETVGIGTFGGKLELTSVADIELEVSGSNATGIGSLYDREGFIAINDGLVQVTNHCMNGVGIGSMNGNIDITTFGEEIFTYVEGSEVCGIGNYHGGGNVQIRNGAIIKVSLLAANPIALGGTKGRLEITGGNIFADLSGCPQPVNSLDVPVFHNEIKDLDFYCKKIETPQGSYQYIANHSKRFDNLHIFLPKDCKELDLQL